MSRNEDDEHDPRWHPPDVPLPRRSRSPVQINLEGLASKSEASGFVWKVLAGVAASVITMAIGFIGGATWSHNTRITTLETHREGDIKNQDKLERRVDNLESRITK